jgi:hypothetical protein
MGAFIMLDEDSKQFAYAFLADRESYHSHKETAAHATFLVEAGLFGALATTCTLTDFLKSVPNAHTVVPLLIAFVWFLFHVLLRWQLRNRRIAALQVATLLRAITDDLTKRPEPAKRAPVIGGWLSTSFDYFIPRPTSTIVGDAKLQQYPDWYRFRYLAVQKEGTGANFGEIFPPYGSIAMLVASLAYVFLR